MKAASPPHSAQVSREQPIAAAPERCDAVAVAVGLIDRKHVGVAAANRDAVAAKGDREYLHPVHTPAPLKPPGFPPDPSACDALSSVAFFLPASI